MQRRYTEPDLATYMDGAPPLPEQRLWRAVIMQALEDATRRLPACCGNPVSAAHIRKMNRIWFDRARGDFREVCLNAGLEPDIVRARALAYFAAIDKGEAERTEPQRAVLPTPAVPRVKPTLTPEERKQRYRDYQRAYHAKRRAELKTSAAPATQ